MRIVIASNRINQVTACYQTSFGDVALTDNKLPCIRGDL
ncbi:hypothetical protein EZS27_042947, partial [termite gut metagenome]